MTKDKKAVEPKITDIIFNKREDGKYDKVYKNEDKIVKQEIVDDIE